MRTISSTSFPDKLTADLLINLCNCIKEGAAILDWNNGSIVYCNQRLAEMLELDPGTDISFSGMCRLLNLPATTSLLQDRLQIIRDKGSFTGQARFSTVNGRTFSGNITMRLFTLSASDYFLIMLEMSSASQPVLTGQQRVESLLDNTSMGIIETDNEARIIHINSYACNMFGYDEKELRNQKIESLIPPRFHARHIKNRDAYMLHTRNRPMGVGMDLYAVKKDGTVFPVEVSLSSYTQGSKQYVMAFVSDITIRKESEQALKLLNGRLEELVQNRTAELQTVIRELEKSKEELYTALEKERELSEIKSRFVTMASHEFRTPLSTVLSSAYLLGKYTQTEDQPKREMHLDRITSSVYMLTEILNDFLSVGKIEEGKVQVRLREFDLPEFMEAVIDEVKNNCRKDQHIIYKHQNGHTVVLDSSLLKHIVLNLLSNASKFSPEKATIELKTVNTTTSMILSVKDEGIGISREDQEHLMERFFRGSNAANIQGTGLGLHIISKYAEMMNGVVECRSEFCPWCGPRARN